MKIEKLHMNHRRNCDGASRSGRNGATLRLAAVKRDKKRSVKAKVLRQLARDER